MEKREETVQIQPYSLEALEKNLDIGSVDGLNMMSFMSASGLNMV